MTEKKDNEGIEQTVSNGCCGGSEKQEKVEVKKNPSHAVVHKTTKNSI